MVSDNSLLKVLTDGHSSKKPKNGYMPSKLVIFIASSILTFFILLIPLIAIYDPSEINLLNAVVISLACSLLVGIFNTIGYYIYIRYVNDYTILKHNLLSRLLGLLGVLIILLVFALTIKKD